MKNTIYTAEHIKSLFNLSEYYYNKTKTHEPQVGEMLYWSKKALNTNMSQSELTNQFNSVYSTETDQELEEYYNDSIAQEFIINKDNYPNGIYLKEIELYFFSKVNTISEKLFPVTFRIVDIKNGVPNLDKYYEGTLIQKWPKAINLNSPTTSNDALVSTKFSLPTLLYLKPGNYAFMLNTNSANYNIGIVQKGVSIRNTSKKSSTTIPYKFFQSDQNVKWDTFSDRNIVFKLNVAKFKIGSFTTEFNLDQTRVDYFINTFITTKTSTLDFGDLTDITYQLKTYDFSLAELTGTPVTPTLTDIKLGEMIYFTKTQTLNYPTSNGMSLIATITNNDAHVSATIDITTNSLVAQTFKNYINSKAIVGTSELTPSAGKAISKYVTKKVELQEGFDSTGMSVIVDVCRPSGTDIEVYCKIRNRYDKALPNFEDYKWIKLDKVYPTNTIYNTSLNDYTEEKYQNIALSYTINNDNTDNVDVTYTDFSEYMIKVVFLSDISSTTPRIQNLRAISSL